MTLQQLQKLRGNQPVTFECVINIIFTLGIERAKDIENLKSEIPILPKEQTKQVVDIVKELSEMQPYDLYILLSKCII